MKLRKAATPVPGPIIMIGGACPMPGSGFGNFIVPLANQTGTISSVVELANQEEQIPFLCLLNFV